MPIAGHGLEARASTGSGVKKEPSVLAHGVRDQGIIGRSGVGCERGLGL